MISRFNSEQKENINSLRKLKKIAGQGASSIVLKQGSSATWIVLEQGGDGSANVG